MQVYKSTSTQEGEKMEFYSDIKKAQEKDTLHLKRDFNDQIDKTEDCENCI